MIDAAGNFTTVAGERLFASIHSLANLGITVRKSTAGQPDREVRVRAEQFGEAQFRVEIDWRDGRSQGQVRVEKIWLIVIKEAVPSDRTASFNGLVVAQLDEAPFFGVDLSKCFQRQ